MQFQPLPDIVCHAYIQRAVLAAGKNVDVVHCPSPLARMMPMGRTSRNTLK
jgi:hypothetical protein